MVSIATKETCKNTPIENPRMIKISEIAPNLRLEFSKEQYEKLHIGLIPEEQEDKWFIYFEDDWLYFHRSWTGKGIFRTQIIKEKGEHEDREYKIKEFYVERNNALHDKENDIYDLDILLQLIMWGLLKLDVRGHFFKKYGSGEKGAIKAWSLFGRMFFPENEYT